MQEDKLAAEVFMYVVFILFVNSFVIILLSKVNLISPVYYINTIFFIVYHTASGILK